MICSRNLLVCSAGSIDDVNIDTVSDHLNLASSFKLNPRGQLDQKKLVNLLDPSNCIKYLFVALSDPLLLRLKEQERNTIMNNLSDLVTLEE